MNYNKLLTSMTKKEPGCGTYVVAIIIVLAFAFGLACLNAWIAMLLWNWVLVDYLAIAPAMGFWPMFGLIELCSILFKTHNFNTNTDN